MTEQKTPLPAKLARRAIRESQEATANYSQTALDIYRKETMSGGAGDWVIEQLTPADLRIPSSIRAALGPSWLELEKLYQQCVDINNEYVGQTFHDALIQLTDNDQVRDLHQALYKVADQIWYRWQQKVVRLDPLQALKRYLNDYLHALEQLRVVKHSLIPHLTDYTELLGYKVVNSHYRANFETTRLGKPWEVSSSPIGTGPLAAKGWPAAEADALISNADLYMVRYADIFRNQFALFGESIDLPQHAGEDIQEALYDIIDMRGRLFGQTNMERQIVEISPGQWVQFALAPCSTLLQVNIDHSREALIASSKKQRYMVPFRIGFDGQLIFMEGEWSTPEFLGIPTDQVRRFQYVALPRIRDRMLEQYSHLPPMETPEVDDRPLLEAPLEEIELAVDYWSHHQQEQVADPQVEDRPAPYISGRLPQLRKSTVIRRLERLGVDVGRAKGSELKFFKPGGRVFVMGDHGGNDRLPSHLLAKMVKRLGLTSREVKHLIVG